MATPTPHEAPRSGRRTAPETADRHPLIAPLAPAPLLPGRRLARPVVAVLVAIVASATLVAPTSPAAAAATAATSPTDSADSNDPDAPSFEIVAGLEELTSDHATVFRLYWAFFGRQPDPGGALYWISQRDQCLGLDAIADLFATSDEFRSRYGPLDNEAFVDLIYHNVLDRPGDADGVAYWLTLLDDDQLTKGQVVLNFALSEEFEGRHPYPSDDVPPRSCHRPDGRPTGRSAHVIGPEALATVAGLTIMAPASIIERAGYHQSTHPGALGMTIDETASIRQSILSSRGRGTHRQGAVDIVTEPHTDILSPVAGTVARAGSYTLYCRHRDGFVVINPDGRPDLEVKILHVQEVAVRAGDRVEVGTVLAANATLFPFRSQIDALTAEPSWPHVHIEVVDPSIPRKPSSGSC